MGQLVTPTGQTIWVPDAPGAMPSPIATPHGFEDPGQAPGSILPPSVLANIQGLPTEQPTIQRTEPQAPAEFKVAPPAQPKTGPALAKSNKQYDAKVAQQRAYEASPEGRIASAEQGVIGQVEQQAQIAEAGADVAANEAEDQARVIEQRNVDLEEQKRDIEATQAKREEKLNELRGNHEKLVSAEANFKVDRGRRWANAGTGSKIMAGIAVAMSALGDALQGKSGPNLALSIIQGAIDDDVNDQVRDFEQLGTKVNRARNSLDGYVKETGDIVSAKQLLIAQRRLEAADEIEAVTAKYASPKAQLNGANAAAALRLDAQKYVQQSAESRFGRDVQREQVANAKAQTGLGYANLRQGAKEFDARMSLENRKLLLESQQLEQAGRGAEAKALREEATKNNELGMVAPATPKVDEKGQPVVGPDGITPVLVKDQLLKNQDGTPWHAPKDTVRNELAKKMAAAQEITSIIDEVLTIRDRVGGETSWGNSPEYQRYKVLQNQLQILAKAGTEGMSSDQDMAALRASLGAEDIASFRERAAGLEEGRERTVSALNTAFKFQGNYSGDKLDFPRTVGREPELTDRDKALKEAVKGDSFERSAAATRKYRDETIPALQAQGEDVYKAKAPEAERAWLESTRVAGINPAARQILRTQAAILTSPKADAKSKESARALLKQLSDKAENQSTREAAASLLLESTYAEIGATAPFASQFRDVYTPKPKAK